MPPPPLGSYDDLEGSVTARRPKSASSLLPWHHDQKLESPPISPTSSASSTASAIDYPPSINDGPFHLRPRSFVTGPLHKLEIDFERTRKAMEESKAEELYTFPDASQAMRMRPILPNSQRKIKLGLRNTAITAISGDLLASAHGAKVKVWSATEDKSASCELPLDGIATDQVTTLAWSESGRYLWVGCDNGSLFELDSESLYRNPNATLSIVAHRRDAHPHSPVIMIKRIESTMLTLDLSGKLVVWLPSPRAGNLCSLHGHSRVLQVQNRPTWVEVLDGDLWLTYRFKGKSATGKIVSITILEVYDIKGQQAKVVREHEWEENASSKPGRVTCACIVPSHRQLIFLGHDSGHVTVWKPRAAQLLTVRKVALCGVSALCGPSRFLWIGREDGVMDVLDIAQMSSWQVIKRWQAHNATIESLDLDPRSLWTASQLRVVSCGEDGFARYWDGLLREDWITLRMQDKVYSYCSYSKLQLGVFTWNIDGVSPRDFEAGNPVNQTLLHDFLKTLDNPDLVSFNFQELIDLSDLTLAARTFLFATKHHDVTLRYKHWSALLSETVRQYFGADYELVIEEKLVGLYTVLFARKNIACRIRDVESRGIKTGFSAHYGNKGSVLLRLTIDETSICLINSHLAAGTSAPGRRERDLIEIFDSGPKFTRPSSGRKAYIGGGDGTHISDSEIVIFSGDLNFRIELPRAQVLSMLANSPTAIQDLQVYDELTQLKRTNPSFRLRNMREAPICFPPTYKYDHSSTNYDTSVKQRTPSWCDRILWRSQREASVHCVAYGRYEADVSDHRPVSAAFDIMVKKRDAIKAESTMREVLHEWSVEEERLLNAARDLYKLN
ncbi:uncharacterized protein JCM15063_001443 [Sporobolomyces koalae]|uniref:uncharacterized protein n=1 Tax=Sporobolomyces koalae TaxID=500713 RepID=UPI00317B2033